MLKTLSYVRRLNLIVNSITMKIKLFFPGIFLLLFSSSLSLAQDTITFGTLLDEMTNLDRLTYLPKQSYQVIQFSSYDRRSHTPGMNGWFANSDGFGNEPIPGFEKVLQQPDQAGIGTYLICDVDGPGAILRLWTARISGSIRFYLDDMDKPVYEGEASDFFWNTAAKLSGLETGNTHADIFRQFDATYFPIPFSERCRIEWTGDIKEIHFYHVGIRLYEKDVKVETFNPEDITEYSKKIKDLKNSFENVHSKWQNNLEDTKDLILELPGTTVSKLLEMEGSSAIDFFSIRIKAKDLESALRTSILNIYFDDAKVPQVHAPIGDFFGAAPGMNPYESYPFSVLTDGTMVCRFVMPFKHKVRIEIENMSEKPVTLTSKVHFKDYKWKDNNSMHFRVRWKVNHDLTASNKSIMDIPYFVAMGKGRIVGSAAFLYNPSNVVTSWGNWWGEGDEKIFIDNDTFPSFFGTGSEDYFNYSWSSEKFFSFPYCGQPRNDGPGNRGYVTNFRWHISDDLIFNEKIAFYMELFHHGVVPDFSYARIVYAYNRPGLIDDYIPITKRDVAMIPYLNWEPLAYLGSAGYSFIQAESIVAKNANTNIEPGDLWSEGNILMWAPNQEDEKLTLNINTPHDGDYRIGFTLAHMPGCGKFSMNMNNDIININGKEIVDLNEDYRVFLQSHFSENMKLKAGQNELILQSQDTRDGAIIGIDFIWIKEL